MATVIIAEKPDAAFNIAKALAEGKIERKKSSYDVEYYEFERNGKKHVVVPAVGHLFNLKQTGRGWDYPVFDVKWVPSFSAMRKSAFSKKYFKTIEEVVENNGKNTEFISACDYDNEGSTIAYNILRFICGVNDAKRMKFSTLTKPDLERAYNEMSPHLDWQNIECGLARHELDFYYGINTTRALTTAIKKFSPRFSMLSSGRVQGPTLVLLAEREKEIASFKPKPFWQIECLVNISGSTIAAVYEKERIWKKTEAEKIKKECSGKKAVVESIIRKRYKQNPPAPFNITSLQTEAYRLFGYSPQQTLNIAQELYTKAYISYPRTSSEKLPPQIGYREILEALSRVKEYSKICSELLSREKLVPVEGKRKDPAHEAIHPTVEVPKGLKGPAKRIYDLVCRRFFSVFGEPAVRESVKITLKIGNHGFLITGRKTVYRGWMEHYGPYAKFDEVELPEVKKDEKLGVKKIIIHSKETSPPSRYSQASIIKEMEKRGLGTRATRAAILQTLYERGYIEGKSIRVTEIGMKVAEVLKKHVPDLVDEKLTRRFEKHLEKIFEGKVKKEKVLEKARKELEKIFEEFKKKEEDIGKELGKAIVKTHEDATTLGECECGGQLRIFFSPFTKKKFVGCTNYSKCGECGYSRSACKCECSCGSPKGKCKCSWKDKKWTPKCQTGYPLPHNASFEKTGKVCESCKTPVIRVIRKGKRPFNMCLDPECETKKEWGKDTKK
ncbi:MAG: DNA topoisomerase I [Candidatus Micrarchaeota archaeon]|nr:DNA topoisomerase I [Candidatus Micrarchaeota archaeon]